MSDATITTIYKLHTVVKNSSGVLWNRKKRFFFLARWPFVPDAHFVLDVSGQVVQHALVGLGSLESSFLLRTAPGIRDYRHPDLAPLKLYFQYLTQLEVV